MAEVTCGELIIGTSSGITRDGWTKSVRWKNMGHWESGPQWIVDCRLCESADVTHSITSMGNVPDTPPTILTNSYLFVSDYDISGEQSSMWQLTINWKEYVTPDLCQIVPPLLEVTGIDPCSWGIIGHYTNFSYKVSMEVDTRQGPSGLDGSDENNPLTTIVSARKKQITETLTFTTHIEYSGGGSITIEAASGSGSVSISDAKQTSVQKSASAQDFTTWTYTYEKISTY